MRAWCGGEVQGGVRGRFLRTAYCGALLIVSTLKARDVGGDMADTDAITLSQSGQETQPASPPAETQPAPVGGPHSEPPQEETSEPRWKPRISLDAIVGAVVAVLVMLVAAWLTHIEFGELRSDMRAGKVDLSGETILLDGKPYQPPKGPVRVEFWTPSLHTKDTAGVADWEKLDDERRLNDFADALTDKKNPIVSGYRRYEVMGSGLGGRKAGTWWVATGEFQFVRFLRLYHEVWHPGRDDIYMEITSASGGHSR